MNKSKRAEGEDGECVMEVQVPGAKWIRVKGLFSVWLRPDGWRMASVAPDLCAV